MTDIMQMLQQLLGGGNTGAPDPRLAAMAQMRGGNYQGSRGAPEKASPRDRAIFNNSGDAGAEDFVNRFGFGAIDPTNKSTGGVPMPRPREPNLDYNNPIGPVEINPSPADPRLQAIQQMQNQGSYAPVSSEMARRQHINDQDPDSEFYNPDNVDDGTDSELMRQGSQGAGATGKGMLMPDEQLLNQIHKGMNGQPKPEDVPQDQWPDTYEGFTKMFGREPSTNAELEYYSDDPGTDYNTPGSQVPEPKRK